MNNAAETSFPENLRNGLAAREVVREADQDHADVLRQIAANTRVSKAEREQAASELATVLAWGLAR